jgi:DNA-binding CsgD family transcriptional regulator
MAAFEHLSRRDAVTLLEITAALLACRDDEQLATAVSLLQRLVRFDKASVNFCFLAGLATGEELTHDSLSLGYPEEYTARYIAEGLYAEDLVLQQFLTTGQPQNFQKVAERHPDAERNVVRRMDLDCGLRDGFLHGLVQGPHASLCFFAGDRIENDPRTRCILEYIIPHVAQALTRLKARQLGQCRYQLSPREVEVLSWLKDGKTSWEISVILGCSERAVNFHLQNLFKKLQATNRTHAVAIALTHQLIAL